jgi:polyhydroxyalkanoate synthase
VLAARGEQPAESVTLLTTFLDFSNTGILDIFVDEASVQLREMTIGADAPNGPKLLKGGELASTFSFLRPNDLVWNYVVGNYLKGEKPPAFDLLYWNSDATNMPGPMYCWYLRNTYLDNALRQPGALTVCGEKLDLGEDRGAGVHLRLARGPHRAVEGRLGVHADPRRQEPLRAGRVGPHRRRDQPAEAGQAQPLDQREACQSADAWLAGATEHPGSWWTDWSKWLAGFGGGEQCRAQGRRRPRLQGDRAGPGPLRASRRPDLIP